MWPIGQRLLWKAARKTVSRSEYLFLSHCPNIDGWPLIGHPYYLPSVSHMHCICSIFCLLLLALNFGQKFCFQCQSPFTKSWQCLKVTAYIRIWMCYNIGLKLSSAKEVESKVYSLSLRLIVFGRENGKIRSNSWQFASREGIDCNNKITWGLDDGSPTIWWP